MSRLNRRQFLPLLAAPVVAPLAAPLVAPALPSVDEIKAVNSYVVDLPNGLILDRDHWPLQRGQYIITLPHGWELQGFDSLSIESPANVG